MRKHAASIELSQLHHGALHNESLSGSPPTASLICSVDAPTRPQISDVRIRRIRELITPAQLLQEFPLDAVRAQSVFRARQEVRAAVAGTDDRLMVVVGPCSIHDVDAAREYGERLAALDSELRADLLLVMRVYFEKPRTTVGWKGLVNDPWMDDSFRINDGLGIARSLLTDLVAMGVRPSCEFLDVVTPQYIADTVTWGAIGARTTESQVHRQLASGLSMPVGFKNRTDGDVHAAVAACTSAHQPHSFLAITANGDAAIIETTGNTDAHIILRGSASAPNYDAQSVAAATAALRATGQRPHVMIDCSHGNSGKQHRRQAVVAAELGERISRGATDIFGVMLESNLIEGRQEPGPRSTLVYGCSVTDACMGWDDTVSVLRVLADATRVRRRVRERVGTVKVR